MLIFLRIVVTIVTIMIAVCMMGYKNKNVSDYIKIFQLQSHEKNWVIKMVFTQVSIYVSLFFSMLVISGSLIKEQMPKKLIFFGSVVQIVLCIASSYILFQFHHDMGRFELILCSAAFAFNGLLFTLDAIITFQQIIFSRPVSA